MLANVLLLGLVLRAASTPALDELAPGTSYDPSIPTLEEIVGHDFGAEMSSHAQIVRYLHALADAAPERTRLLEYGRSWEGRSLSALVVAGPERISRLDALRADLRRFADPRSVSGAEARELLERLPVVSMFLHSVHGDELSSSDAALAEAYHLLAAREDAAVERILRESVVVIDPLQNPDGRERFLVQNLLARAHPPDALPIAAEHDETWPSGRVNHYLFDLNRDWVVQTQVESAARGRLLLEWYPHVVADLHEMGGVAGVTPRATYYFPPPAPPRNPHLSEAQIDLLEVVGRANAERFDERGFPYFTREVFGGFFPGTGSGWPLYHGGLGMTFEKASAHGLRYRRVDGSVLTYRESVIEHFTAALQTMETAARERERVLETFFAFRSDAVARGEAGPTRAYLIPPGRDPALHEKLGETLLANGVEVGRAEEPIRLGERSLPSGTFLVSLAQPSAMMARNLLDREVPLPTDYLGLQRERKRKRYPVQVYDISAWSLPLLYDLEVVEAGAIPNVATSRFAGSTRDLSRVTLPPARVAYLLPWNATTARIVVEALGAGLTVRVANEPLRLGGRDFGVGTAIVRVPDHGPGLAETLGGIVARHGGEAVPADTGYVDSGISLGSNQVRPLRPPRVLLAWDAPTDSYSAGWTRYVLERHFGLPVSIVRVASLPIADLFEFDVVVLPAGDYSSVASQGLPGRLRTFMERGGTLVTLSDATVWATEDGVELIRSSLEYHERDGGSSPSALEQAVEPPKELPFETPGALARVVLDEQHWLSAGTDGEIQTFVTGRRIFTPLTLDAGVNVGVYAEADRLRASGLIWEEVRDQLAEKAAVLYQRAGRGQIVGFAEDPNFRAYNEMTMLLFVNAVLLGPAHLPIPGVE